MRIVQTANFYSARSGGLRVVVDVLGRGYTEAGHERVLIVPGAVDRTVETPTGVRIELASPKVPGGAGYRLLVDGDRLKQTIIRLRPDRVESSDKLTMAGLGAWARRRGIGSVMFSHERLDVVFKPRLPKRLHIEPLLMQWNRMLGTSYDRIVCASRFSAEEFTKVGVTNVDLVPLGVDHVTFRPPDDLDANTDRRAQLELIYVGRLSKEKRPDIAIAAVRALTSWGVDVHLSVVGAGPQGARLRAAAEGLPVTFVGLISDRHEVARRIGHADVALVTCPVEAFGLVALEAMACGTAVVTAATGGASELITATCGRAAEPTGEDFARAAVEVSELMITQRRAAARSRAMEFDWAVTIDRMLAIHASLPAMRRPRTIRRGEKSGKVDQSIKPGKRLKPVKVGKSATPVRAVRPTKPIRVARPSKRAKSADSFPAAPVARTRLGTDSSAPQQFRSPDTGAPFESAEQSESGAHLLVGAPRRTQRLRGAAKHDLEMALRAPRVIRATRVARKKAI